MEDILEEARQTSGEVRKIGKQRGLDVRARNPNERSKPYITLERRMLFPLPRSPSIRTVFDPTGAWALDSNSCFVKEAAAAI